MTNKSRLSQFPPYLVRLLIEATTQEFRFPMTFGKAIRRRQQLYRLRKVMHAEGHHAFTAVDSVSIRIDPPSMKQKTDNPVVLIIGTSDDPEFEKMITAAFTENDVDVGLPTEEVTAPNDEKSLKDDSDFFNALIGEENDNET